MGLNQKFVPIRFRFGRPIATREYFPRKFGAAVRQRSRWVTGIALQSWEYHSAQETLRYAYWFWRDRKSLVGNLVTPLTNIVFAYGAVTWMTARAFHGDWGMAKETAPFAAFWVAGLSLQAFHTAIRVWCSSRIYGWRFAGGVPVRVVAGNWINCFATARAIWNYAGAKARGLPLRWAKTEHAYPNRATLLTERKKLGEILTGSQGITPEELKAALATKPEDVRLGEHLLALGLIEEEDLYTALSLQNDLPRGQPERDEVSVAVTRALPAALARKWRVLPYRVAAGELHLAGANLPEKEMREEIGQFTSLEIRVQLVTPSEFEELAASTWREITGGKWNWRKEGTIPWQPVRSYGQTRLLILASRLRNGSMRALISACVFWKVRAPLCRASTGKR